MNKFNDVVGPLIHLFGWSRERDAHTRRLDIDSPCGSIFLDFAPDRQDGMWWTIAHHDPYWQIEFSHQTPSEAIASVTQALPQLLGDHRHADRIPLATESTVQLANASDWELRKTNSGVIWTSPDDHCTLEHSTDPVHPWQFKHSVYDGFDTHWTATFTPDVPGPLVAQFFTHLTSSIPVERVLREVPHIAQVSESTLITPVRGSGLSPHAHHAVAQAARTHTEQNRRR